MTLADDDRGLALGIVVFFGILAVGALLFMLMNAGMSDVFTITSDSASSSGADGQIGVANAVWDNMLYYVLFLGVVFLIARAVREGARS